jgi:single-stranded-DNA-specific exonuclease
MDHAYPALELLLTHDAARAYELADQIDGYNQERQSQTRKVMRAAELQLSNAFPISAAFDRTWPAGVVGLVASRLVHAYQRPAVVVGGNGQHAVGSARAPEGVNILELLRAGEAHALKLGGHARAAGFSVEFDRVPDFIAAVQEAGKHMKAAPVMGMRVDAAVKASLLSWDTLQLLEQFAPFGEGNKPPVLVTRGIMLAAARPVGKDGSHAKCLFMADGKPLEGIAFGLAPDMPKAGGLVDIAFELSRNVYKGRHSLQAHVHDIAPSGHVVIDGGGIVSGI